MLKRSDTDVAYLPDSQVDLPQQPKPRSAASALAIFLAVFFSLQGAWEMARNSVLERFVIHQGTVIPAVALIVTLTPDIPAQANGTSIKAPGGGLNILNGCEGTEIAFLMIAAIVAAGLPWRTTFVSISIGLLCVFLLNQVRILTLFYVFRSCREWFDLLHSSILPAVLVALTLAGFRGILYFSNRRPA